MATNLPRKEEQRGTRKLFMWAAGLGLALAIALAIIFFILPIAGNQ